MADHRDGSPAGETNTWLVSARDIAEALVADGECRRNQIDLRADHTVGLHVIPINLHAEASAPVTINVARSTDEAERQARARTRPQGL